MGIELLVGGQRVRSQTGDESEGLKWHSWDVRDLRGRNVQLRIFETATGGWGHILIDQIVQTDVSRHRIEVGRLSSYRRSAAYYREPFASLTHRVTLDLPLAQNVVSPAGALTSSSESSGDGTEIHFPFTRMLVYFRSTRN